MKIVTDNAANMLNAFRNNFEPNEDIPDGDSGSESSDDESFCVDVNLEREDRFIEANNLEYENMEVAQQSIWAKKHLRCAVHSLQLVVREFEKKHSSKAIKAAIGLVKHFRKSSKSAMRLKELSRGKALRPHCRTRWSSLFRMIDRLLELQEQVSIVCREREIDNLQQSQWKNLAKIRDLLAPFSEHTLALEMNNSTSISLLIPAIADLENHLDRVSDMIVFK